MKSASRWMEKVNAIPVLIHTLHVREHTFRDGESEQNQQFSSGLPHNCDEGTDNDESIS